MSASVEPALRRTNSVHSGRIVASEVAVALVLAGWGRGVVVIAVATMGAVAVLTLVWVPAQRRPLYQWLGVALRFVARRWTRRAGADPLDWISPGARLVSGRCDGDPAGVIEDVYGRTVLLELGDPGALIVEPGGPLPSLAPLATPGVRLHLILAAVPPLAGAAAPASSYRQLTEGRLPAQHRAVLSVQALRDGDAGEEELDRVLSGTVRRVRRRFAGTGVRLLPEPVASAVLDDLLHDDGAGPAREAWGGIQLGGLFQSSYRLRPADAAIVPRLLAVPATAVTVNVAADLLTVRLAAPDAGALVVAEEALRRIAGGPDVVVSRLDGEHGPALAATLGLGGAHSGQSVPIEPAGMSSAGLMLGLNRRQEPVVVRLMRGEPTRVLLVGGPRAAQRLTLRAMALGARVVVHTARPQAWESFVRGVAAPGASVAVLPPGRPAEALAGPGTALCPQLVVVDAGALGGEVPVPPAPWRTALIVRDELTPADLDALTRADLVVLQPLTPAEATLAASALGLGAASDWFTRIHGGMVAVVARRTVRWVLLSETQVEQQLLGTTSRG